LVQHAVKGGPKNSVLRKCREVGEARSEGTVKRAGEKFSGDATVLAEELHDAGRESPVVF
jgi:hypothetical protein